MKKNIKNIFNLTTTLINQSIKIQEQQKQIKKMKIDYEKIIIANTKMFKCAGKLQDDLNKHKKALWDNFNISFSEKR